MNPLVVIHLMRGKWFAVGEKTFDMRTASKGVQRCVSPKKCMPRTVRMSNRATSEKNIRGSERPHIDSFRIANINCHACGEQ